MQKRSTWREKATKTVMTGVRRALDETKDLRKFVPVNGKSRKRANSTKTPSLQGGRFIPEPMAPNGKDIERLDGWGFEDTKFYINSKGNVELAGKRYALSGHELPKLLPWIQKKLNLPFDSNDIWVSHYPTAVPEVVLNKGFINDVEKLLKSDQIDKDDKVRLRHGHGHTQDEMYSIKHGKMIRIPDLVVYPEKEEEVTALVESAKKHNVVVIPFGGGTNVTDALRCPEDETRMIVSVDMRRMDKILWVDPVNRMACIEAGAVGRNIFTNLARYGYTIGHEPDSVEFSTMGGWVATHASGMKKNKYGNIESILLDINVVTTDGLITRSALGPRESLGIDPRLWLLGSEGNLGIITSAVVKIFPLPEVKRYGSVLFPNFEEGVGFMYELAQQSSYPASVRMVDNLQFQLSQALKPFSPEEEIGWKQQKNKLQKLFVTHVKGFDVDQMVACTLVFEGSEEEVSAQERAVYSIAKNYGGLKGGSENGERGYQLTYGIAYIRDFMMNHYLMAESFETSAPWSDVIAVCDNVKRRILEEHTKRRLPGNPFVTCRVTQLYQTGAAIYFYFAFYGKGVKNPSEVYLEIENAARDEILKSGGSLSHHHGIGKLRRHFLPTVFSETALKWRMEQKRALDPQNIFGAKNHWYEIEKKSKTNTSISPSETKVPDAVSNSAGVRSGFVGFLARKWNTFLVFLNIR